MPRPLLLMAAMLIGVPALAQQLPVVPLRSPKDQVWRFLLTNQSGQVIVSALAQMTDGKKRVLTYSPLPRKEARWIVVPKQECLDSLVVHLNDGETLRADHMNDCTAGKIVVGPARVVVVSSQALPGR
jgi:hypothetical protein